VDGEPFVYAFGDDLVKSEVSFTKQMVAEYEKYNTPVVGVQRVPETEVSKYGIVELKEGTNEMQSIVEKPDPKDAPSQLAQFGRFVLTQDIVDALAETKLGKGDELWLTDAIERYLSSGGTVRVKEIEDGTWLTTGDPLSYVLANIEYAMDRGDIREALAGRINTKTQTQSQSGA